MKDENKSFENYSRVLATATKLETLQSNLDSVLDLFLPPIVELYTKLRDDCLKLLFESEFKLDNFRKAEELIWRRIYHDIYRFQKTRKQRHTKHEECLIESHFISGFGFYSSLIVRLRFRYKIHQVQGLIAPLNLTLGPLDNFVDNQLLNEELPDITTCSDELVSEILNVDDHKGEKEWAQQAIYRSLVYMGDIARYLLESDQQDNRKLAFKFYRSASRCQPEHGLPFNQLATLAGGSNHNLDAVCNYMRCSLRPKPFEGADSNMRKMFELNNKFYAEVSKDGDSTTVAEVLSSKEPSKSAESMMKSTIVTFIKLAGHLWTAIPLSKGALTVDEIAGETQTFFERLREALELGAIVPLFTSSDDIQEFCPFFGGFAHANKPLYVTTTIMYEFCSVALMLIAKCQRDHLNCPELDGNYIIDLANTLALNLLHYSTSSCQKTILSKLQELKVNGENELDSSYIYRKTYLPTIKIFCDWLLSNGDIISSNLESFQSFHEDLGDLISLLQDLIKLEDSRHTFNEHSWIQKYPLSCDFPLMNLTPLKSAHELNINFGWERELSDSESGLITTHCIVAFFHALAAFLINNK